MRSVRLLLAVALVGLAALNGWTTLRRSAIPLELHGLVGRIEKRFEKRPDVDDVYLVWIAGRRIQVDRDLGVQLRRGQRVDKRAWARTLRTSRGDIPLTVSRDFRGMLVTMPILVLTGILLLLRRSTMPRE